MSDILQYKVTIYALGSYGSFPISPADFAGIRLARKCLQLGLGVEEKIDLVLENYAELERCLLEMALEDSIFFGKIKALLDNGTHLVNRRIVNLLTTARLYLDQLHHDFASIYGKDSEICGRFKEATANEYDTNLGYRLIEALRNHAQHRSLPVQGITFSRSADDSRTPRLICYSVIPSINIATLEDDPDFKKRILDEIKELADSKGYINILPFIREYVESLGRIHQRIRELSAPNITAADNLIETYRDRYRTTVSQDLTGLAAIGCDSDGLWKDHEYLNERPISRRKDLIEKNFHLDSISRRYVTSKHSKSP